jgi:hypothetical protein
MKPLSEMTRWLHILIATLVVWSQDHVQSLFKKLDAESYHLLGVLLIAIVGMQLADKIATAAIEHIRVLRRMLAGRNDIEGDWVNIVVDTANPKQIIGAEYCRIRYRNGEYVLSGDTWTLDGKWVQDFRTGGSCYKDREFEYYYRTGVNRVGGFGVMIFTPTDSLPAEFVCRYVDEGIKSPHVTRGRRASSRLRKVYHDERRKAALDFAEKFEESGLLDFDSAFKNYRGTVL